MPYLNNRPILFFKSFSKITFFRSKTQRGVWDILKILANTSINKQTKQSNVKTLLCMSSAAARMLTELRGEAGGAAAVSGSFRCSSHSLSDSQNSRCASKPDRTNVNVNGEKPSARDRRDKPRCTMGASSSSLLDESKISYIRGKRVSI